MLRVKDSIDGPGYCGERTLIIIRILLRLYTVHQKLIKMALR